MFKFGKDYKLDLGGGGVSLGAGARGGSALEVSKNSHYSQFVSFCLADQDVSS